MSLPRCSVLRLVWSLGFAVAALPLHSAGAAAPAPDFAQPLPAIAALAAEQHLPLTGIDPLSEKPDLRAGARRVSANRPAHARPRRTRLRRRRSAAHLAVGHRRPERTQFRSAPNRATRRRCLGSARDAGLSRAVHLLAQWHPRHERRFLFHRSKTAAADLRRHRCSPSRVTDTPGEAPRVARARRSPRAVEGPAAAATETWTRRARRGCRTAR